jgi:hypothetical protein
MAAALPAGGTTAKPLDRVGHDQRQFRAADMARARPEAARQFMLSNDAAIEHPATEITMPLTNTQTSWRGSPNIRAPVFVHGPGTIILSIRGAGAARTLLGSTSAAPDLFAADDFLAIRRGLQL